MAYDYSNVLAAIAKGVDFNPLGNVAEGWMTGRKMNIAQQQADADTKTAEAALLKAKNPQYDVPTSIQEYLYGLKNPGYAAAQAAKPHFQYLPGIGLVELPTMAGGGAPSGKPTVVMGAPPKPRSPSSLKAEDEISSTLAEMEGNLDTLNKAYDLAPKTLTGVGAGKIAQVGTDWKNALNGIGVDTTAAEATKQYLDYVKPEAMKGMSKFLRPMSDKDLNESLSTMADPNASVARKQAAMNRLRLPLKKAIESKRRLLKQFQNESGADEGGDAQAAPPPPSAFTQPNQRAIDALKGNPQLQDEFDKKFGPGAAMRILNGG